MATTRDKEHTQIAKRNPCPECGCKRVWFKNVVPTRKGHKRRMVCFDCGCTFYPRRDEDLWAVKFKTGK